MATKKAAKKTITAKKPQTKAMVNWKEEMERRARAAAAIEEGVGQGGNFLSLKGGRLAFQGADVPGNKMNVVIVDHILENHAYAGRYNPDVQQSPICFAFGRVESEMAPHEKSAQPQNDICKTCPLNDWGSADTGSGKACKNIRRLALLTEDQIEDADTIEAANAAFLKVPVTSVKGWAGYVRQLEKTLGRPPFGVITEISVVPDAKTQFKLQFKMVETIEDDDVLGALVQKQDAIADDIAFPYQPPSEDDEEEQPRRGRGGGAAKKVQRGRPVVKKAAAKRSKY
jgi:hypothetical protein